jgi:hypothetical protein
MLRLLALIGVLLAAHGAAAHDVPVNPSTCTFDPLELRVPATGVSAAVSAPGAADAMRVVYTVATATAQFQQPVVAPRAFTVGAVGGTIAFPEAFNASLLANGDLRADDVALVVTLGGVAATVPVELTTSVAVAGDQVVRGSPMAADGRFTLAGVIPPGRLPAPLDVASTVALTCRVTPMPDLDQFAPVPAVVSLAGTLSASAGKLRAVLKGAVLAPAMVTGGPAILHLDAGGTPLATVEFAGGFTAQGSRTLRAQDAGGSSLAIRLGKGRAPARLQAKLPGMALPAALTGTVDVQATLVAGSLTARGGRPFRVRGGTLRGGS